MFDKNVSLSTFLRANTNVCTRKRQKRWKILGDRLISFDGRISLHRLKDLRFKGQLKFPKDFTQKFLFKTIFLHCCPSFYHRVNLHEPSRFRVPLEDPNSNLCGKLELGCYTHNLHILIGESNTKTLLFLNRKSFSAAFSSSCQTFLEILAWTRSSNNCGSPLFDHNVQFVLLLEQILLRFGGNALQ